MQGMGKLSRTRSGLLWEVERILRECGDNLPQFLMMENVPLVHSERNIQDFNDWISFLDSLGYKSKWQDLNAKDFGIPQNRDRCFMISWLEEGFSFMFPQPVPLTMSVRNLLDLEVGEKYYLESKKAELVKERLRPGDFEENEIEGIDLTTINPRILQVANTIKAKQRSISNVSSDENGARVKSNHSYRIRRLTEAECLRLMGVSEMDSYLIRNVTSSSQVYKQAGNSIVVDVMVAIFDNLFNEKDEMPGQMTIYDYL